MLFARRWLLFVVCCLVLDVCCWLSVDSLVCVRCLMFVVRCWLFVVCFELCSVRRLLSVVCVFVDGWCVDCCRLFVFCCCLLLICLFVVGGALFVVCCLIVVS